MMLEKMENQPTIDNSIYAKFVGIKFIGGQRTYFFGIDENMDLNLGDKVVVETMRGLEIGEVAIEPVDIENYKSELGLKPVLRKATDIDLKVYESNARDAKTAMEICQVEVDRLKLDMNLISCDYTLDKSKVLFSYLADERVDFRELLKILAVRLHTRIELRQVGPRDKAKMVGGIGICGLPLCCSTFLNEFDGISINRAKNQMLAINIPKLSGQCGKLICCLKYEDDAYTIDKKEFPEIGTKLFIDKIEFTVTSINIINKKVRVDSEEDVKILDLEEYQKLVRPVQKEKKFDKNDRKSFKNKNGFSKQNRENNNGNEK